MKYICSIRGAEQRPEILSHIEMQLPKIERLERRRCKAIISISSERHMTSVEVIVRGSRVEYTASGSSESITKSIDQAIAKICKQMSKKRGRIKDKRSEKLDSHQRAAPGVWEFESLRGAYPILKR